jgi:hypothetical protein
MTAPQPLWFARIGPPAFAVLTFALGVLDTTVLPFAPAFFFLRAVVARSD